MYSSDHVCPKCKKANLFIYCAICNCCCHVTDPCCTLGQDPRVRTPEAMKAHEEENAPK